MYSWGLLLDALGDLGAARIVPAVIHKFDGKPFHGKGSGSSSSVLPKTHSGLVRLPSGPL